MFTDTPAPTAVACPAAKELAFVRVWVDWLAFISKLTNFPSFVRISSPPVVTTETPAPAPASTVSLTIERAAEASMPMSLPVLVWVPAAWDEDAARGSLPATPAEVTSCSEYAVTERAPAVTVRFSPMYALTSTLE